MILLRLFYEFFKVGLFSIGGGAATIPFLSRISDTTGWYTQHELANMIAVSESTPGAIGANMASYVGYTTAGVFGSVVTTIALVAPSIITIVIIAKFLQKFAENKYVKHVFYGLRPASTGLIAAAAFEIVKIALINIDGFLQTCSVADLFNVKNILFFILIFAAMKKWSLHPIAYIAISAVVGIIFKMS